MAKKNKKKKSEDNYLAFMGLINYITSVSNLYTANREIGYYKSINAKVHEYAQSEYKRIANSMGLQQNDIRRAAEKAGIWNEEAGYNPEKMMELLPTWKKGTAKRYYWFDSGNTWQIKTRAEVAAEYKKTLEEDIKTEKFIDDTLNKSIIDNQNAYIGLFYTFLGML